jgi:hypothetical protein
VMPGSEDESMDSREEDRGVDVWCQGHTEQTFSNVRQN